MSRKAKACPNVLTVHEINKKILSKAAKQYSEDDCLEYNNKYRDENYKIYETKRRQFLETGRKYREMNKLALLNNKVKLEEAYSTINFDFLEEIPEDDFMRDKTCESTGILLRKRTERPLNQVPEIDNQVVCMIEPWFKRYLILNKFVQAARKVIYQNRLIKNLEKLRYLDKEKVREFESTKKQCENVSYKELFDKYL